MKAVFVLLADSDGTMHSTHVSWGAAVATEEEAQRYVQSCGMGYYGRSYQKLRIFDTFEEAQRTIFMENI